MSYGNQLNIFSAKAKQYGKYWKGIVLCRNNAQLLAAVEDAHSFMQTGKFHRATNTYVSKDGAHLRFRVLQDERDALCAFAGHEFSHIIWLTDPPTVAIRSIAHSRLRSGAVPKDELRYEYAMRS